jgi:hypothetical protein
MAKLPDLARIALGLEGAGNDRAEVKSQEKRYLSNG